MEGSVIYDEACQAGDTAGYVARLSAQEIRLLYSYSVARMAENGKPGGVPAIIKWVCMIDAAQRFLKL